MMKYGKANNCFPNCRMLFISLVLAMLTSMTLTAQNDLFIVDGDNNELSNWNLDTNTKTVIIPGNVNNSISNVVFDAADSVLYYLYDDGFSEQTDIKRLNLRTMAITTAVSDIGLANALAYDGNNKRLYWAPFGMARITFADFFEGVFTNIDFITTSTEVRSIDVDKLTNDIFFINDNGESIKRRPFGNSATIVPILTSAEGGFSFNALDLKVDHLGRRVFWADDGSSKIFNCNLDGSDNQSFFSDLNVNKISLDVYNKKVYWSGIEAPEIRSAFYNGTEIEDLTGETYIFPVSVTANIPEVNTDVGTEVIVEVPVFIGTEVDTVEIIFDNVLVPGITTVTVEQQNCPDPPPGVVVGNPPICYFIETTTEFSGEASIQLSYANQTFSGIDENQRSLFHFTGVVWEEITDSVLTEKRKIKGRTSSFSPFAVFGLPEPPTNIDGLTILANEDVEISAPRVVDGNIHANDDISLNSGGPSTYYSDLTAVDNIDISRRNSIEGDVTAESVDNDGTISGAVNTGSSPSAITLPVVSPFVAGGPDVSVDDDEVITLPPGSYGEVEIERDGELRLSAGTYYFEELVGNTDTRLRFLLSTEEDTIRINVTDKLRFGNRQLVSTSLGEDGSGNIIFKSLQTSNLTIGGGANLMGTIIAPDAKVRAGKDVFFRGVMAVRDAEFGARSIILDHLSSRSFPKRSISDAQTLAEQLPAEYVLAPNYPNPFNPETRIRFGLPASSQMSLKIFNVQGQLVRILSNETRSAGFHELVWDGTNEQGQQVSSGVYFYMLQVYGQADGTAVQFQQVRKMLFLK